MHHDHQPPAPVSSDESLSETFFSVSRLLRHASKQTLEPWGITPSQSRALRELSQHGVMRPSELAEHLRIAPRSTTEVVDGLQDRDLVRRLPDPNDRRATLIELTERGAALSADLRAARQAEAETFFGSLAPDDRAELLRLLRLLRATAP